MEPVYSVLLPVSGCTSGREGMRIFSLSYSPNSWEQGKEFFIFFFFPYFLASDIESQLLPVLMFHKGTGAQLCALA